MQVQELIDILSQQDPESEVRLAFQPNWPLAFEVGRVQSQGEFEAEFEEGSFEWSHSRCAGFDFGNYCRDCDERKPEHEETDPDDDGPEIVWISEAGHPSDSPYAPKGCFETF